MEELLDTTEEMVTDEVIDGVTEVLETVEEPSFETMVKEVESIFMYYYSKGVLHTSVAIGAGASVYTLLKNRKRVRKTISTFVKKNKEALKELKQPDTPKVVTYGVVEPE